MNRADICEVRSVFGWWEVYTFLGLDAGTLWFEAADRDGYELLMHADGLSGLLSRREAVQVGAAIAIPVQTLPRPDHQPRAHPDVRGNGVGVMSSYSLLDKRIGVLEERSTAPR
jgi:hypothetical protein